MLAIENLLVFYENGLAVNNVSLEVRESEIVGLVGSNGAGKSTLMYAISGIILDRKIKQERRGGEKITVVGQIRYRNRDITELKPSLRVKEGIVLCPERRRIFAESSVLENLKIGASLRSRSEAKQMFEYVWQLFPVLFQLRARTAGFLSGGEQQMLAMARALMASPQIMLLDEPSLGLAPLIVQEIFKIMEDLNKRGITFLLVEQNAYMALEISNRAYVLQLGEIALEGESKLLMDNEEVKKKYMGE